MNKVVNKCLLANKFMPEHLSRPDKIILGNPIHNSVKQSYTIKNVRNLDESRQKVINLINDNAKIISEGIYKSKENESEGKGLNILTPKQMLQRLQIALPQVKSCNISEVY